MKVKKFFEKILREKITLAPTLHENASIEQISNFVGQILENLSEPADVYFEDDRIVRNAKILVFYRDDETKDTLVTELLREFESQNFNASADMFSEIIKISPEQDSTRKIEILFYNNRQQVGYLRQHHHSRVGFLAKNS